MMRCKIAVIGLGVGYALSCALAEAGYEVVGVDVNPDVVRNPRRDASVARLLQHHKILQRIREHLVLTTDYNKILGSSFIIICVSTGDEKNLILGNVEQAIKSCLRVLKDKNFSSTILIYSTLPFGSSRRIREIFQQLDAQMDEDIGYCYMPLMIAQGTTADDFVNPPFVAFGSYFPKTAEKVMDFYLGFIQKSALFNGKLPPHYVVAPEIAELAKLVANAFLSTKISFANMVASFCEESNLDGETLLKIVGSDWRIGGFMLKPGYSFGGACFPRDLRSLIQTFEKMSVPCPLLEATNRINEERAVDPIVLLKKNKLSGKILILGIAYKAGISDMRGSPTLRLLEAFKEEDYDTETYDPNVDRNVSLREAMERAQPDILIVTTREKEFASLEPFIRGTRINTILDYAGIVEVDELPQGTCIYKAGRGWVSPPKGQ
jgi:nucleotide sugar dehydrogenase